MLKNIAISRASNFKLSLYRGNLKLASQAKNRSAAKILLYRGLLLYRGSLYRGSTVLPLNILGTVTFFKLGMFTLQI